MGPEELFEQEVLNTPEEELQEGGSQDNVVPINPGHDESAAQSWQNDPAVAEWLSTATPEQLSQISPSIRAELEAAGALPGTAEHHTDEHAMVGDDPNDDPNDDPRFGEIYSFAQQMQMQNSELAAQVQQLQHELQSRNSQQQPQGSPIDKWNDPDNLLLDPAGYQRHLHEQMEEHLNSAAFNQKMQISSQQADQRLGAGASQQMWKLAEQTPAFDGANVPLADVARGVADPIGFIEQELTRRQEDQFIQNIFGGKDPEAIESFLVDFAAQVRDAVSSGARDEALGKVASEFKDMPASLKPADIPPSLLGRPGASGDQGFDPADYEKKLLFGV